MRPKEKADELVNKFIPHTRLFLNDLGWTDCLDAAKCCALIAVDEILTIVKSYEKQNCKLLMDNIKILYWHEVKQEINNL